jgi:hypothetical protein
MAVSMAGLGNFPGLRRRRHTHPLTIPDLSGYQDEESLRPAQASSGRFVRKAKSLGKAELADCITKLSFIFIT